METAEAGGIATHHIQVGSQANLSEFQPQYDPHFYNFGLSKSALRVPQSPGPRRPVPLRELRRSQAGGDPGPVSSATEACEMSDPWQIIRNVEAAIAEHCGSRHAVAVDTCSMALFLCCKYRNVGEVSIPRRTYVSVRGFRRRVSVGARENPGATDFATPGPAIPGQ